MITFHDILGHYGIKPKNVKLVRHGNREIPVLETFQNEREHFEVYQSYQAPNKFKGAKHLAVFAPGHHTSAIFLGLWDIKDYKTHKNFTKKIHDTIDEHSFPESWHKVAWYDLRYNPTLDELSERLIIDWGKSTISWVQNRDKKILEIKGENYLGDFVSYDSVQLNYYDIKKLSTDTKSNTTWMNALSSVNGIYLIRDKSSGKLYVGSAYGEDGLYGRWLNYAHSGHGGNKELKGLDPNQFEFSILEIIPPTSSAEEVIHRENRWKEKLGTRVFGLNAN